MTTQTKIIDRFWSKVEIRAVDECWPWRGTRARSGHGQLWNGERLVAAHRFSLELRGVDLSKKLACHKCNNPWCVNPKHLYAGTYSDNSRDAVAAGAFVNNGQPAGSANTNSILTEECARFIKSNYVPHSRHFGTRAFARKFGVSQATISKVVRRETWLHV